MQNDRNNHITPLTFQLYVMKCQGSRAVLTKETISYTKDPTFGENSPSISHTNVRARAIGADPV